MPSPSIQIEYPSLIDLNRPLLIVQNWSMLTSSLKTHRTFGLSNSHQNVLDGPWAAHGPPLDRPRTQTSSTLSTVPEGVVAPPSHYSRIHSSFTTSESLGTVHILISRNSIPLFPKVHIVLVTLFCFESTPPPTLAGPALRLAPGGRKMANAKDLGSLQKASLGEVLDAVKQKLHPGKELNEKEMEAFADLVFEDWQAGDDHDMPSDNACVAGIKDVGFKFGILLEAAGASPAESGKKRPRARVSQQLHSDKVGKSKYAHRQENQPVWFMVEKSNKHQLSLSLLLTQLHISSAARLLRSISSLHKYSQSQGRSCTYDHRNGRDVSRQEPRGVCGVV